MQRQWPYRVWRLLLTSDVLPTQGCQDPGHQKIQGQDSPIHWTYKKIKGGRRCPDRLWRKLGFVPTIGRDYVLWSDGKASDHRQRHENMPGIDNPDGWDFRERALRGE